MPSRSTRHSGTSTTPARERGAALAISSLMLIIMTVLAIAASHAVRMQSRSATAARDRNLAFQQAETGLRGAERWLAGLPAPPEPCKAAKCRIYAPGVLTPDGNPRAWALTGDQWWRDHGWPHRLDSPVGAADADDDALEQPHFVIEESGDIPDSLTVSPSGPPSRVVVYQVTARARAGESQSAAILQSRFARRFE